MSTQIPERILIRRRRRQPDQKTGYRPWRPVRRKALLTPPTGPVSTAGDESKDEGLERRERRRRRRRLHGRRRTGPSIRFLNIE